jgi:hypothetical protein
LSLTTGAALMSPFEAILNSRVPSPWSPQCCIVQS